MSTPKASVKKSTAKAVATEATTAAVPAPTNLTWETVKIARHPDRPLLVDYLAAWCPDAEELHGDRLVAD
ncbi:MAG: hypothetical protein RSB74_07555, partial [Kiritimatiellia bacterium]